MKPREVRLQHADGTTDRSLDVSPGRLLGFTVTEPARHHHHRHHRRGDDDMEGGRWRRRQQQQEQQQCVWSKRDTVVTCSRATVLRWKALAYHREMVYAVSAAQVPDLQVPSAPQCKLAIYARAENMEREVVPQPTVRGEREDGGWLLNGEHTIEVYARSRRNRCRSSVWRNQHTIAVELRLSALSLTECEIARVGQISFRLIPQLSRVVAHLGSGRREIGRLQIVATAATEAGYGGGTSSSIPATTTDQDTTTDFSVIFVIESDRVSMMSGFGKCSIPVPYLSRSPILEDHHHSREDYQLREHIDNSGLLISVGPTLLSEEGNMMVELLYLAVFVCPGSVSETHTMLDGLALRTSTASGTLWCVTDLDQTMTISSPPAMSEQRGLGTRPENAHDDRDVVARTTPHQPQAFRGYSTTTHAQLDLVRSAQQELSDNQDREMRYKLVSFLTLSMGLFASVVGGVMV